MFSDPIDGTESDTRSFDEEDMYGSDTGVISVSMKPQPTVEPMPSTESHVSTHASLIVYILDLHTMNQDTDLSTQFERMNVNLGNISIIMEALCEAEGIDVSSITDDADAQSSASLETQSHLDEGDDDMKG
jgi:hypothetical protein